MLLTFKAWVSRAQRTDNPVGDFLMDAKTELDRMPEIQTRKDLASYLARMGACSECRAIAPDIWKRFEGWKNYRRKLG